MIEKVISGIIDAEIERLTQIKKMLTAEGTGNGLSLLSSSEIRVPETHNGKSGKSRLSPEGRKAIADAAKKRAANNRAAKTGSAVAKPSPIQSYWQAMTPKERAREMRRRMKLTADRKAKQAAV